MKQAPNELVEPFRRLAGPTPFGPASGNNGAFAFRFNNTVLRVIVSDGFGWDHISVSTPTRCPTWEEMEYVRDLFSCSDEWWMQLGAPRAQHINCHPYCLHWWRPQTQAEMERIAVQAAAAGQLPARAAFPPAPIPVPPSWTVGPKDASELRAMAEKVAAHIRRESREVM